MRSDQPCSAEMFENIIMGEAMAKSQGKFGRHAYEIDAMRAKDRPLFRCYQ